MIKIHFSSLGGLSNAVDVNADAVWGDALNTFFHQCSNEPGFTHHPRYQYIVNRQKLGHDIDLGSPIKDSIRDGDEDDEIKVIYILGHSDHYRLTDPWNAWILGKPWPPCSNYYGNEPFNQKKIGFYHGKSHCSVCDQRSGTYEPLFNNTKDHMVILDDGTTKQAYNKHQLLERKTTITGKKLVSSIIQQIRDSKGKFEIITI